MEANVEETQDQGQEKSAASSEVGGPYAWYVLIVLVLVYIFNFLDRTILSILAEDIKADLGISDAEIGFLYGTAFAVFYAVFGIPLARLADVWTRTRLISIGLCCWSVMTAMCGTAKSMTSLTVFRIGVGVGESSASPAAFSMLGDYFSPRFRATALAIYSSGVFIGSGIGLFLGGWIMNTWNTSYADGGAPFDLRGWQAAFIAVGLPGLIMAVWVFTLREPVRGQSEGLVVTKKHPHPFRLLMRELAGVLPPFTLWSLANAGAGKKGIALNLCAGACVALTATLLIFLLGGTAQWAALGLGVYCIISWLQDLSLRDPACFTMIFRSKAIVLGITGFGFISFKGYGIGFWLAPYLMRYHGVSAAEVGMYLGLAAAFGGWAGVTGGGMLSDYLKRRTPKARIWCGYMTVIFTVPIAFTLLMTENLQLTYALAFFNAASSSMWIGSAVALSNELVLPRMRATASSFYILMMTFVGLAMGPYTMGRISDAFATAGYEPADALRNGIMVGFGSLGIALVFLFFAGRYVEDEEKNRMARARAAGEPGI